MVGEGSRGGVVASMQNRELPFQPNIEGFVNSHRKPFPSFLFIKGFPGLEGGRGAESLCGPLPKLTWQGPRVWSHSVEYSL